MKKIFISSPLRSDTIEGLNLNIERVKSYCHNVILNDGMPIAPHAYFTGFLDAFNVEENELAMKYGIELLKECDEMYVVNKYGISEGMKFEIECAKENKIPIKYYSTL